jgi:hypothetical protein
MASLKSGQTCTIILMNIRMIIYSNIYAFKHIRIQIYMYTYIYVYVYIHNLDGIVEPRKTYTTIFMNIRMIIYSNTNLSSICAFRHVCIRIYTYIYRATPHSLIVSYKSRHIRTIILTNIRMIMYSNIYAFKYICICIYTPSSLMVSLRCHQGGRCSPITCIYTYSYI